LDYEKLLSGYDYAEIRFEKVVGFSARISDGEAKQSAGTIDGIGVRVLEKGSWGFASGDARQDVEKLLESAQRLARLGRGKIALSIPKPVKRRIKDRFVFVDPVERLKALREAAKDLDGKNIASRTISVSDSRSIIEFYNSEGADISQDTGYSYLSCSCVAREGANLQRGNERSWSRRSFDKVDLGISAKARGKAQRLLKAASPPKGRFTVVLDPEMTGVFSHEAVGHACEADAVVDKESILAGKIGTRIGNELVTIYDDPTAEDFGRYAYDDEGVEARKTSLVEKGILKGYIDSMETAKELGIRPNGHARAESYSSIPIVRMSNTYFQKGGASLDDVFDVRKGVYLKGMRGGSVDIFAGGFMFKAEEAYMIKDGEKTELMHDVSISGNILQTMKDVECVGKDWGGSPGMCGKGGQSVPVSDGGPHIRIRDVAIG